MSAKHIASGSTRPARGGSSRPRALLVLDGGGTPVIGAEPTSGGPSSPARASYGSHAGQVAAATAVPDRLMAVDDLLSTGAAATVGAAQNGARLS